MHQVFKISFILSLLFMGFSACKQEAGSGGMARIRGQVLHHEDPIPFASVYIHYGSNDIPTAGLTGYEDSTRADAQGNYTFNNLKKGKYYLYSIGYDANWSPPSTVFGGMPAQIYQRKEDVILNIPVSE
jgi:hypothetical protein